MRTSASASPPRILVFNFFGGVLDRGIPHYAQDVVECMRRLGFQPVELRCPRSLVAAPRYIRNLLFVLAEQIIAPLMRIASRCSFTVYCYNSAGVVDALLGRSVVIVHDLIPNRRRNATLAARYVRITQAAHTALRRPVCAASAHTFQRLQRLRSFRCCPLELWPNAFYSFERALTAPATCSPGRTGRARILLCSGIGSNKDYAGAIRMVRRSPVLRDAEIRIVGFGDDAHLAMRRVSAWPTDQRERIVVLPRLTLRELIAEYQSSDVVWVHSKAEGFGRWIVEAKLCGRPVVASRIGAFLKFVPLGVHCYRGDDFDSTVRAALAAAGRDTPLSLADCHAPLEAAMRRLVSLMTGASPAGQGWSPYEQSVTQGIPRRGELP